MKINSEKNNFLKRREDFPILQEKNRGKPMVYLDSAASAQKPRQVIDAISQFYTKDYANIHRGIYELSERATDRYEAAREQVKSFIHAAQSEEIIFVRGTTEAINLAAQSLSRFYFQKGDEILVGEGEHHSNIVPWYALKQQGIDIKIIPIKEDGSLDINAYKNLFSPRTKLAALSHASNTTGIINPIKEMTAIAHAHHALLLVDGAQAVPHLSVDMQELDCDFYAFSAHKLYGPTGIGVLYGKKKWLDAMPIYQGGGGMIETVDFSRITFAKTPNKFEAGTPDIAGAVGLNAAISYLQSIGMHEITLHEQQLLQYTEEALCAIPQLRIIGTAKPKVGVISFVIEGIHPHDLGTVLDHEGIAVRAGHHCAMPLMQRFNLPGTVRISFGIYNHPADIDTLIQAIHLAKRLFS